MPGTVKVSNFAGQHKDAKIALQALARLILKEKMEHLTKWHTAEAMSISDGSMGSDEDEEVDEEVVKTERKQKIVKPEMTQEFDKTETTLLPALKEELAQVDSHKHKGGYSALPPFVIDHLARYGKDLKLSLSNQMIISVKNSTSFAAFMDLLA